MAEYKIDISTIIKEARKTKKYSLRKLSKLTGISHSFLGDIESGRARPKYENLMKILSVLEIPVTKIFLK